MKNKYLKKSSSNETDELKTCDATKKRWCEFIIDVFLNKVFTTDKKVQKKRFPFAISMLFDNKGFDYINLRSILHLDIVKNLFPDKLKIDEFLSVAYSLGKTLRKKISNYKETAPSSDTNDDVTYGTGIVECDCQQHKDFVDENHDHVLTGDLRILRDSKLIKLFSKGLNFGEAMSINWNKFKRKIEIGLDSSIERIVSTNPKVTMDSLLNVKERFSKKLTTRSFLLNDESKFIRQNLC